jgi:CRISPR system Cascade subunit CasD
MNPSVLLWLESPMQSWGFESKFSFGNKTTFEFPTKSGVMGLLCCALGMSKDENNFLEKFTHLHQTAFSYKKKPYNKEKNDILSDFNMIASSYDINDKWESLMSLRLADGKMPGDSHGKLSIKKYVLNSFFAVILEVPEDLVSIISDSLVKPVWPIYLGRKNCIPNEFIYQGTFYDDRSVKEKIDSLATEKELMLISMCSDIVQEDYDDKIIINDVLLSLGLIKRYQNREVYIKNYV